VTGKVKQSNVLRIGILSEAVKCRLDVGFGGIVGKQRDRVDCVEYVAVWLED
jgi:hypothetical protein